MEKIQDIERIRGYYEKYGMEKLFDQPILPYLELIRFNRQEYLCHEEESMAYLMFFVEGKAKVFRTLANGKSLLISFYEPFEVIGEVELIDNRKASCHAQALTVCYVLALNMKTARKLLGEDVSFLKFACTILAEKLHHLGSSSSVNLFYPLENRLASYILMVAVKESTLEGQEQFYFHENLTHLSELLGTSYRHLLRTLNGFCQKNILIKEERGYFIAEKGKLESLAGDLF